MDERMSQIIKKLNWDYHYPPQNILNLINKKITYCGHWDFELIFTRILERLTWYDILYIFGPKELKLNLTKTRISKIYHEELKDHFEKLRKILCGESISFTKWGPEFSKEIKYTLFSNRWYST